MRTWLLVTDAYLVGLAAVVALVVYPSFREVGLSEWRRFHERHSRAISIAVGPIWLLQGVLCALWIVQGPHRIVALLHGSLALAGVLSTVFGAVPQHNRISTERTLSHLQRLQLWHAVRTAVWVGTLICAMVF